MPDFNQLLAQFRANGTNDPQIRALEQFMRSAQGQNLAQNLSPDTASRISQAAQAAQHGDMQGARAAVDDILRTPEGAALAARLKSMMGK